MAPFALQTKLTIMNVVVPMTAVTGPWHVPTFQGFRMAGSAFQALVGSVQNELRACVMIKVPVFPVSGIVTEVAVWTQS